MSTIVPNPSFVKQKDRSVSDPILDSQVLTSTPQFLSDNKVIRKPPPLFIDTRSAHSLSSNMMTSPKSVRIMDLGHLDSDEQQELEEDIKSRRLMRRQRSMHQEDDDDDEDSSSRVAIGTRVAEGHRNYQLMYDMLTGIRIAVGRVSAKISRPLSEEDFVAAHKLVFDVAGNELTPGVKYDFKFKDYAPWVFRYLREKFHVDAADYMMSLTNKYILSEIGSPGKSGSFFYYSRDYRFIIKTIHHSEHKFMRKILKDYYEHVSNNPNTLLCRFYGLHRIKLPRGRKIHFVVMGNVLPPNKDIHQTYDLKGSLYGRLTSDQEIEKNPRTVRKDQNWIKDSRQLQFGDIKQELFLKQLERDVDLLKRLRIMDYSLLIGIHDLRRGNTECIRDQSLQMITPRTKKMISDGLLRKQTKAEIMRKALKKANAVNVNPSELPVSPSEERRWCIFYADDGGFRSSDQDNKPLDKIYYVGVIDILTPYNITKRVETFWKSITQDKETISSVNPLTYGKRFMSFMIKAVTGASSTFSLLDEKKCQIGREVD
ncbi:Phosphatidylinositol 4-phosphate 5-kinase its3 [Choanephora cucurbitarum]|uniref:1-phosphatidylinositol-4-phosphate 5-kinase n=1 Tax=Choanephora cucurbitarum TaxID=101091 RepID=A0A1C7N278_9FUNG|nr:Phosphatidylinositol 4-phosphate 5-kinase its3 [Choanephora cucurbitarum]